MSIRAVDHYNRPRSSSCCCAFIFLLSVTVFIGCLLALTNNGGLEANLPFFQSSIPDAEISGAFQDFVKTFKKEYQTPEEEAERQKIFADNYKKIAESNSNPYRSYTLEVNKFADLTDEEFAIKYTSSPKKPHAKLHRGVNKKVDPNVTINWVDKKKVTGVKDQGNCGSCWTFSAISIAETFMAIQKNAEPSRLSEQQLVDCCITKDSHGCHGGEPTDAFNYLIKTGIAFEKDYPYHARDEACQEAKMTPQFPIQGFVDIPNGNTSTMEKTIQTRTMAVGIHAGAFVFRFYKNGVIDSGCPAEPITHGVTVVGAGIESGIPYWLVRNSWGKNWGDKGYVKIARTNDPLPGICGIATCAQYVK